jgi:hypothetical protein
MTNALLGWELDFDIRATDSLIISFTSGNDAHLSDNHLSPFINSDYDNYLRSTPKHSKHSNYPSSLHPSTQQPSLTQPDPPSTTILAKLIMASKEPKLYF